MNASDKAIRDSNIAHIKKVMRRKETKERGWPGAPLTHFGVLGDEPRVMSEMIADGSVVIVERPKTSNPNMTAVFVCLPA